jgi:hypothetical protein
MLIPPGELLDISCNRICWVGIMLMTQGEILNRPCYLLDLHHARLCWLSSSVHLVRKSIHKLQLFIMLLLSV